MKLIIYIYNYIIIMLILYKRTLVKVIKIVWEITNNWFNKSKQFNVLDVIK